MNKIKANEYKYITLIITQQCNLHCTYCYEKHKSIKTMTFKMAKSIIDKEVHMNDYSKAINFDLFGGEPFLNFNLIKKITQYIKSLKTDKKCEIFIGTNGTLVHDKIQKWLLANKNHVSCGLSFDGNKKMQNINRSNSFKKIDLSFFKKNYPNIIIKMTISKESLKNLSKGVKFLHKQGFKSISANLAYGINWQNKNNINILNRELKKLIKFYLKNPQLKPFSMLDFKIEDIAYSNPKSTIKFCGAGTHMHTYDTDGKVYPCHFFTPLSIGKQSKNTNKIKFTEIVNISNIDDKCKTCIIKDICPSCYGFNYSSTGNIYKKDITYCELTKIMIKACSYFKYKKWKTNLLKLTDKQEKDLLYSISLIQTRL